MEVLVFLGKTLVAFLFELAIAWSIAGDYFRGKKGLIVDVLAAIFIVGLSWLLIYIGRVEDSFCDYNEVPQYVEGVTFDTKQCSAHTQWLLNWGETFQTSFGMHPVIAAIVLYLLIKWGRPLVKYITSQ